MEEKNLLPSLDMREYMNKVKDYSYEKLMEEKKKIENKLEVLYTVIEPDYYHQKKLNIKDNIDEIERIRSRKRVAELSKLISSQLKNRYGVNNFSLAWDHINKVFMDSTEVYRYVTVKLNKEVTDSYGRKKVVENKVPFADKLSLTGLESYRKYLLCVSYGLDHIGSIEMSARTAIATEVEVCKNDRSRFYTRYFLPADISSINKKIVKLEVLRDMLNKTGNLSKSNEDTNELKS